MSATSIVLVVLMIAVLCGLLVLIILDLLRRNKQSHSQPENSQQSAEPAEEAPSEKSVAASAVAEAEEPEEQPEEAPAAAVSDSADSVSFAIAASSATLEEKYLDLTPQYKSYYDQIVQHANRKDGAKRIKNASYEEYKLFHARLVRLQIKGGVVVCQFLLLNTDFQNYLSANKLKVKQAPVVLRVTDDESLAAAKSSIDIAYDAAVAERERKMQARREKVKQAREAKKNEQAAAAANAE